MSRTSRLALGFLIGCFCICAGMLFGRSAFAQTDPHRGPSTAPRVVTNTPPPLPFGTTSSVIAPNAPLMMNGVPVYPPLGLHTINYPVNAVNPVKVPKLSEVLRHYKGKRHLEAANGSTIVLTGDLNYLYLNDETLPYNADVFYLCQNMTPSTYYRYMIFPPNGSAVTPGVGGTGTGGTIFQTLADGTCRSGGGGYYYAQENLATPVGSGTDPAYPGVWTVAMQRGTCTGTNCATFTPVAYDAVAFTVVIATINFGTYSDPAYSLPQVDYQPNQTIYFSASGLTSNHQYAFGVVYTGGNGLPCVFSFPSAAQNQNNATCFHGGTGQVPTGIIPFGGVVQGSYTIPAAPNVGTYSLQLYDVTTQDLVSTQQISIQPSTVSVTLQPFSGTSTNTGTNMGDTFATDGIISVNGSQSTEQSVSGLNVSMNSLTSGHVYTMSLSTPNGAVLTQTDLDTQTFGPPQSFTASGTTSTQAFTFPLITSLFTAIGPTLTSFAPNVMTMQIYDKTAGSVLASKSMHVLAYTASTQWTSPAASSEVVGVVGTPETVEVTNNAGSNYGTWNADGIKSIVLAPDANNYMTLTLNGTTATDSNGQTWNITSTGGTIVATPAINTQYLQVGATINIPLKIAVPTLGRCQTTYCTLRTAITPYHGIAQSAYDVATNGLQVYGTGGTPATGAPTYQWVAGAGPGGLGTPRFPQMMYDHGTQGVTTGNYTMKINVSNCGATKNLMEMKFTMPASFDANTTGQAPTLSGVTINGTAATWALYTKSTGGNRGNPLAQNEFAIGCTSSNTANGCGIPYPTAACTAANTGVVTLNWPIPLITFPLTDVTATANYQGGCATAACGLAAYSVGPVQQLINTVPNNPTNVDSTQLGFFSLDGSLMTALFSPGTVAQGVPTSSNFQFTNTPTAADPNPDYVDEIQLTVPSGVLPTSITPPTNWYQNSAVSGGGNTVYTFSVCSAAAPPCGASLPSNPGAQEPNALAPGATINFTFNWPGTIAVGTYNISWVAYGANGGAHTKTYTASVLFANTTAQVSFDNAGAGDGTPTGTLPDVVTSGQQATIGSDYSADYGNGFVLQLYNNGSQTITAAKINIPAADVLSAKPADSTHDWQIVTTGISAPYVYPGNGGSPNCSGTVPAANIVEPIASSGTAGSISLSGCTLAPGATLKIYFASAAPYDQPNHFYRFNGTVTSALTANASTQTAYTNSDTILVVDDARLHIYLPTGSTTIPSGASGGATFNSVVCTGCSYTNSPFVVNFGTIAGTFTATDIVNAVVGSDAQGSHGWQLYVQLSSVPAHATFVTDVDNGTNKFTSAYYTINQSTPITPSTGSPGTLLSTFTGATAASTYAHTPVQNLMNAQVQLPTFPTALTPGADSVTLVYTLIAT